MKDVCICLFYFKTSQSFETNDALCRYFLRVQFLHEPFIQTVFLLLTARNTGCKRKECGYFTIYENSDYLFIALFQKQFAITSVDDVSELTGKAPSCSR